MLPKIIKIIILATLFYIAIISNLYLASVTINFKSIFIVLIIITLLVLTQLFIDYKKAIGISYDFFLYRIIFNNTNTKNNKTLLFVSIINLGIKQKFFDKIYQTATVVIKTQASIFEMRALVNHAQVYNYLLNMAKYNPGFYNPRSNS